MNKAAEKTRVEKVDLYEFKREKARRAWGNGSSKSLAAVLSHIQSKII